MNIQSPAQFGANLLLFLIHQFVSILTLQVYIFISTLILFEKLLEIEENVLNVQENYDICEFRF